MRVRVKVIKLKCEFFPYFLFRFETSSVHFMSRKTDISHGPIDDLASKLIKYGKESTEKDHV